MVQVDIGGRKGKEGVERGLDKVSCVPKALLAEGLGTASMAAASLWLKKKMSRYGQDKRSQTAP